MDKLVECWLYRWIEIPWQIGWVLTQYNGVKIVLKLHLNFHTFLQDFTKTLSKILICKGFRIQMTDTKIYALPLRGSLTNYDDKILGFFDHLLPCVDIFNGWGINLSLQNDPTWCFFQVQSTCRFFPGSNLIISC